MTNPRTDLPDPVRSALRVAVDAVEADIACLVKLPACEEHRLTIERLFISWGELVKLLALGPEPLYRRCPVCNRIGMREATLCGYCWTKLDPLGSSVEYRGNPRRGAGQECR